MLEVKHSNWCNGRSAQNRMLGLTTTGLINRRDICRN